MTQVPPPGAAQAPSRHQEESSHGAGPSGPRQCSQTHHKPPRPLDCPRLSPVKDQPSGRNGEGLTKVNLFHLKVSSFYSKATSFLPLCVKYPFKMVVRPWTVSLLEEAGSRQTPAVSVCFSVTAP